MFKLDRRKKHNIYMLNANIGIEKECLRVNPDGTLATTEHPFAGNDKIDRDFSENQIEFITDASHDSESVYTELFELHRIANSKLAELPTGPEYIWPCSNPPAIEPGFVNNVAQFSGDKAWKTEYREHLKRTYGTRLMLYSGIHFNLSFDDNFFRAMYAEFNGGLPNDNQLRDFKSDEYLNLASWLVRYSWVITYLLASSSVLDESFFTPENAEDGSVSDAIDYSDKATRYASPRTSEIGYWNKFNPILDFETLDGYVDSIEDYVKSGQLNIPAELYYPIRLKSKGTYNLDNLRSDGVDHLEIRTIDVNPYSFPGIFKEDIQFLHLLCVFLAYKEYKPFTQEEQLDALINLKNAALYDAPPLTTGEDMRVAAKNFLRDMKTFYRKGTFSRIEHNYINKALDYQFKKLEPGNRYAERFHEDFSGRYMPAMLNLAKYYAKTR